MLNEKKYIKKKILINDKPLEASIPPTAYSDPTVDFLGLVLGLCNIGRRSGKRWYFIASIKSF